MKQMSYQQFAIVAADSAQSLTDQLNDRLIELRGKDPHVTFEGLIARISYTEHADEPESVSDFYELAGIQLCCEDCPMFSPILKADGSEDQRVRYGDCPYASYGRTYKNSKACDQLFRMINDKEVRLCFAE